MLLRRHHDLKEVDLWNSEASSNLTVLIFTPAEFAREVADSLQKISREPLPLIMSADPFESRGGGVTPGIMQGLNFLLHRDERRERQVSRSQHMSA